MGLPEKEAKRLLGYKDASLQEGFGCAPGDFSSVFLSVVELRGGYASAGLTVADVNDLLNKLSVEYIEGEDDTEAKRLLRETQGDAGDPPADAAHALVALTAEELANLDRKHQTFQLQGEEQQQDKLSVQILTSCIRKMSPIELKWLARMILKETKLGVSVDSVLGKMHPTATSLLNEFGDVKSVLDILRTGDETVGRVGNFLFQPIKPMLGMKLGIEEVGRKLFNRKPEKDEELKPHDPDLGGAAASPPTLGPPTTAPQTAAPAAAGAAPEPGTAPPEYFVETKLDGERMICHMDKSRGRLELITRNGNDYTPRYAPQMKELLFSLIHCDQIILDGEMMAYDEVQKRFLPFGQNRSASLDLSGKTHLCYMVFDILLFKGANKPNRQFEVRDLRANTLSSRKKALAKVVRTKKNWVELVEWRGPFRTERGIEKEMERAIENREEGIMVKNCETPYRFGARKAGWWKLKPEYGKNAHGKMDLVIIGAYFADTAGRRRGGSGLMDNCSKFLLGLRVEEEEEAPAELNGNRSASADRNPSSADAERLLPPDDEDGFDGKIFAGRAAAGAVGAPSGQKSPLQPPPKKTTRTVTPFTRVGTGYSAAELKEICERLKPHAVRYDPAKPPDWLGFKFPAGSRPDVVLDNLEAAEVVLEIEASEIIRSVDFEPGYTCRFPRCTRLREDKGWDEAMSYEEFAEFLDNEKDEQRFALWGRDHVGAGSVAGSSAGEPAAKRRKRVVVPKKKAEILGQVLSGDREELLLRSVAGGVAQGVAQQAFLPSGGFGGGENLSDGSDSEVDPTDAVAVLRHRLKVDSDDQLLINAALATLLDDDIGGLNSVGGHTRNKLYRVLKFFFEIFSCRILSVFVCDVFYICRQPVFVCDVFHLRPICGARLRYWFRVCLFLCGCLWLHWSQVWVCGQ